MRDTTNQFSGYNNAYNAVSSGLHRLKAILNKTILVSALALSLLPVNLSKASEENKDLVHPTMLHENTPEGKRDYFLSRLDQYEDSLEARMLNLKSLNPEIVERVIEKSDRKGKFTLYLDDVVKMMYGEMPRAKLTRTQKDDAVYTFNLYRHWDGFKERERVYNETSLEDMVAISIVESNGGDPARLRNPQSSASGIFHVVRQTWGYTEGLLANENPDRYQEYRQMNWAEKGMEVGWKYFSYLRDLFAHASPTHAVLAYYTGPGGNIFSRTAKHYLKKVEGAKKTYQRINDEIEDLSELRRLYQERQKIPGYRADIIREYERGVEELIIRTSHGKYPDSNYNIPVPDSLYESTQLTQH